MAFLLCVPNAYAERRARHNREAGGFATSTIHDMGSKCSKSSETMELTATSSAQDGKELSPAALCADMKASLAVGTRYRHPLKRFTRCFSGMEAVDWMLRHKQARDASEAVRKGQTLLNQHFIVQVDGAAEFENDRKRFYRFSDRGGEPATIA